MGEIPHTIQSVHFYAEAVWNDRVVKKGFKVMEFPVNYTHKSVKKVWKVPSIQFSNDEDDISIEICVDFIDVTPSTGFDVIRYRELKINAMDEFEWTVPSALLLKSAADRTF